MLKPHDFLSYKRILIMSIVLLILVFNAFVVDVVIEGSTKETTPSIDNQEEEEVKKEDRANKNDDKYNDILDSTIDFIDLKGIKFEDYKMGKIDENVDKDHALIEIKGEKHVIHKSDTVLENWIVDEIDRDSILLKSEDVRFLLRIVPGEVLPYTSYN